MNLLMALCLALAVRPAPAAPVQAAGPSFKRVMTVIFENTDYEDALAQPFFGKLAKEGATLADYHGVTHPSQPNYIALTSGDTHGVKDDKSVVLDVKHIGDLLEAQGKSWKVYAEAYPGDCFRGARAKTYARKHVPFLSYKNVQEDPARCARIVDASALAADAKNGSLPDYSLFIPDMNDDGHDTGVDFADLWLSETFGPLLKDPKFMKDLLLVVTFDEDSDSGGSNRILAVLYGAGVAPGSVSKARYDHYSLLRTVEDALGLGNLGFKDASAAPISGVWR